MTKLLLLLVSMLIVCTSVIAGVSVKGYYRSNGTYVQPHMRSSPDGNFSNNWSTVGNVNPYTGKAGTKTTPNSSSSNVVSSSTPSSYGGISRTSPLSIQLNDKRGQTNTQNSGSSKKEISNTSQYLRLNGINWTEVGRNNSDILYVARMSREYSKDGLPVISLLYTGAMKENGIPVWLGQRVLKVKVNCFDYTASAIEDKVINSKGVVVKNVVLTDHDYFTWFNLSELGSSNNILAASRICS